MKPSILLSTVHRAAVRSQASRAATTLFALLAPLCSGPAGATSADCAPVLAAMVKLAQTPNHQYKTETAPYIKGTRQNEVVIVGSTMHLLVAGHWRATPYDAKQLVLDIQDSFASPDRKASCAKAGEQAVGGEAATLYKMHDVNDGSTVDGQLWVSNARGLPLRQVIDIVDTRSHSDTRFDYANVQAPASR